MPPYVPTSPPEHQQEQQQQHVAAAQRERQWRERVMRCFFTALALDALECVKAAVSQLSAPRVAALLQRGRLLKAAKERGSPAMPPALLPPSAQPPGEPDPWPALTNRLLQQDMLDAPPALGAAVPGVLAQHNYAAARDPAGGGPFRPADFAWTLAARAVQFVLALASLPAAAEPEGGLPAAPPEQGGGQLLVQARPAPGPVWAMACFPALHYMIVGMAGNPGLPGELLQLYRSLRAKLEARLGPEVVQPYPVNAAPPQQQGEQGQQQQQQQQQAAGPGRPQSAPRQPGGQAGQRAPAAGHSEQEASSGARRQVYASDQPLARLPALPDGAELPVLAVVWAQPQEMQVGAGGRSRWAGLGGPWFLQSL